MAQALKFTKANIAQLPLPVSGRDEYYDVDLPALRCRVSASSDKVFSALLWVPRERRKERQTFGKYPAVTPEMSRTETRRLQGLIAMGVNPAEQRRALQEQECFGEMGEAWLQGLVAAGKRSAADQRANFERSLGRIPDAPLGHYWVIQVCASHS